MVCNFSLCQKTLIKNGISNPYFSGDVVYRARKFRYDPCKLIDLSNQFILNGYQYLIYTVLGNEYCFICTNSDFIDKLKTILNSIAIRLWIFTVLHSIDILALHITILFSDCL